MRRRTKAVGVPVAVPFAVPIASSHDRHSPLRDGAFRRITPGALAAVRVLVSRAGGRE
jgi:hypothetical protein